MRPLLGSILDWAVVAIPVIAGLAAWFIPVKNPGTLHRVLLTIGAVALSGLIYLQQCETRVAHERELGKLPTAVTKEVMRELVLVPKAVTDVKKEIPPATPAVPKEQPKAPPVTESPSKDDIAKGLRELKSLIVGQKWGLDADHLILLSRRMAPFASSRDRGD